MQKVFLIVTLFLGLQSTGQSISFNNEQIQQCANRQLTYKNERGQYYGAGFSIDGLNTLVVFKDIRFDKASQQLKISGTTYSTIVDEAARVNGVLVFLAKPKGNKLEAIKTVGYSLTSDTRSRDGDFEFSFKVSKGDRLYFEGGESHHLLEYDLTKLLSLYWD